MNPDEVSKADLIEVVEALRQRVADLEAELEQCDEQIDRLEAWLRQYENQHTPPSKHRHSLSEDDDDLKTDGGTVGRYTGHEPAWRPLPKPDEGVEVTADSCPTAAILLARPSTSRLASSRTMKP